AAVNDGSIDVQGGELVFAGAGTSTGSFTGNAGTTILLNGPTLAATSSVVSPGTVILDNLSAAGLLDLTGATSTDFVAITGDLESLGSLNINDTLLLSPTAGPTTLSLDTLTIN